MRNLQSIKLNKEFKRAYYKGKFKAHPLLVTYLIKNYDGFNKVGITCSKKIGKAYVRNRARRIIRHAYLKIRDEIVFDHTYNIVFVARAGTAKVKSHELEKIMRYQINKNLAAKK